MKKIILIILSLIIAGGIVFLIIKGITEYEPLGESVPIMGKNHVALGASHESYNSNPPTSGPHAGSIDWGIYQDEVADENAIHNLEHGGVWITYQDKDDVDVKNKLEKLVKSYKSKVLLSPRSKNDNAIAVVSWGRIMKLDDFDAEEIKKFIKQYKNKGPEYVPD